MNVAVQMEFKADRKEPLGDLLRRVAAQFERSGVEPEILATFSDGPAGIRNTSAVERAIRKHPHLSRFDRDDSPMPGLAIPPVRHLTNGEPSNPFPMADILALADGVPRSLPFHSVSVHFGHTDFGRVLGFPAGLAPQTGIVIGDSWWVNGRNRSLSAFYAVEGDAASKKLPDPAGAAGAILTGLGKPKRVAQFVAPGMAAAITTSGSVGPPVPSAIALVSPIIAKYRSGMTALIERIGLPYDLPAAAEVRLTSLGASGPLKPALVEAFARRGYDCRGGGGTFTLRRRTTANNVIDVELDVGTWSRSLTFMFHVRGPGFNATLLPPVTARGQALQYPIGDTANWERIVANIGAIVDELERTFVGEIEAAAGAAPEWFEPGR
jgi:hypothetical protein